MGAGKDDEEVKIVTGSDEREQAHRLCDTREYCQLSSLPRSNLNLMMSLHCCVRQRGWIDTTRERSAGNHHSSTSLGSRDRNI